MKLVKCDKCGLIVSVGLVDSDYVCDGEDSWLISEQTVAGKELDLCKDCFTTLKNKKYHIEEEFVKDIGETKRCEEY